MNILGVQGEPPAPEIAVPGEHFQTLERKLMHFPNIGKNRSVIFQTLETERPLGARPVIVMMPGGAGERWPHGHYGLLAKNLISSLNAVLLVAGDPADQALCDQIAAAAGDDAISLAGRITLPELAAVLSVSDCVVCNAGDGMYLAAALGAPVVPVCGLIDPAKNAPLGKYARFDEKKALASEPEFEEVSRTLTAVTTDMAYGAVLKMTGVRR
jgi:ADP-heptose:LPS heptosyltransferase